MSLRIGPVCAALLVLLCRSDGPLAQSHVLSGQSAILPISARPLVAGSELSTNGRNTTRQFTLLAEAEGLDHIHGLLSASAIEEQWAYLPDQGLWLEIGIDESGFEVETDVEYLTEILTAFDRVHLYHFHPARYFEPGLNPSLALALPSPADVESSITVAKMQETLNPESEVRNFVVSPYGVVEYAPTPLGRELMLAEETHPRATIERNLLTVVALRRGEFNVTRTLKGAPHAGPLEIIAELCSQLSGEFYEVQFVPRD